VKTFLCSKCDATIFFENVVCETCGSALGYVPEKRQMAAFSPPDEQGVWHTRGGRGASRFRPCRNYRVENVCNWMIPADSPDELCDSCRLTQVIPALDDAATRHRWYLLEKAKRTLIYSLRGLHLPIRSRAEDPERGLSFQFLEAVHPAVKVLIGHESGIITLNVDEAEDVVREQMRTAMHEPYRTLLGHFRHEIGHYYWDLLVPPYGQLAEFRRLFGDERQDYQQALDDYYQKGPPPTWGRQFISAYATAHPWEDWAETWAHYLLISDALHTAEHWGFTLKPAEERTAPVPETKVSRAVGDIATLLLDQWVPLALFLNSMNRTLGHSDAYPFVLPPAVVEKLRFIDQVVKRGAEPVQREAPDSAPPPQSSQPAML